MRQPHKNSGGEVVCSRAQSQALTEVLCHEVFSPVGAQRWDKCMLQVPRIAWGRLPAGSCLLASDLLAPDPQTSWPSPTHEGECGMCCASSSAILSSLGRGLLRGEAPPSAEGGRQPPREARAPPAITALRMMKMFVNGAEAKG